MLIVGFALFAVSAIAIGGVYAWARWDSDSTGRVKYVAPRYLVACAIGAVVGAALIAFSP